MWDRIEYERGLLPRLALCVPPAPRVAASKAPRHVTPMRPRYPPVPRHVALHRDAFTSTIPR